jgi:hypothetical protein
VKGTAMGYAKYIGRVGALAVALGFGAAVATTTPGIAYADGEQETNNEANADPGPTTPNPDPTPEVPDAQKNNSGSENEQKDLQEKQGDPKVDAATPGSNAGVLAPGGAIEEVKRSETEPQQPPAAIDPPPPPPAGVPVSPPPANQPQQQVPEQAPPPPPPPNGNQLKAALSQADLDEELNKTLTSALQLQNNEDELQQLQRLTSLNEDALEIASDDTMMMAFSMAQDEEPIMAAAAAEPAAPTFQTVLTGLLSLVGLGPNAGTPTLPFVPTPILEFVFAVFRRIEATFSNETPTAVLTQPKYELSGDMSGQIEVEDDFGDTHTYEIKPGDGPSKGTATVDENGVIKYVANAEAWDEDPDTPDEFVVTVSDENGFHIHSADSTHTTAVTVSVPGPVDTTTGVQSGTLEYSNPAGGPVTFNDVPDDEFEVDDEGNWIFEPTDDSLHEAANEANPVKQKTFTVDVLDEEGNVVDTVEVTVAIPPANEIPSPVPGAPAPVRDPNTGIISGSFRVVDGDEDELVITGLSEYGVVDVDQDEFDPELYHYTVTPPQTLAAGEEETFESFATFGAMRTMALNESEPESFETLAEEDPVFVTFTIRDGYGGEVFHVVQLDAGEALVDASADGAPQGPAIVDASRDRAYQISYVSSPDDNPQLLRYSGTTHVTVIDTVTGQAIGENIAIPGRVDPAAVISGDTSHVFLKSKYYNPATGAATTYIAAIDAETGELVDNDQGAVSNNKLLQLPVGAEPFSNGRLLVHGNRIYALTETIDSSTGTQSNHLAVIDAGSGQLLGTPVTFTGERMGSDDIVFGENDRAYLVRHDWTADPSADKTNIAVINTATGQLVGGAAVSVDGQPTGDLVVDDRTDRAFLTTVRDTPEGPKTWVNVVDTAIGLKVGTPVERDGRGMHSVVLSKDGDRAYQLTQNGDYLDPDTVSTITVINTTTGAVDGIDIVLDGSPGGDLVLDRNANGNEHAYVTTQDTDFQESSITVIDLQTRSVVDEVVDINGFPSPLTLSSNGKTVYRVIAGTDPDTSALVTRVAVFDTVTGTAIGQPIEITGGQADEPQEVGDRLYVQTTETQLNDPEDFEDDVVVSRVAVINTETGQRLGIPVETEGNIAGDIIVNGDRAYQRTEDEQRQISRITVINTDTGQRVGATPVEVDGLIAENLSQTPTGIPRDAVLVFGENDRAYQVTEFDEGDGTFTVRLAVINTETGALVNVEPVVIDQFTSTKILEVADDGRVYLTVLSTSTEGPTPSTTYKTTLLTIDADSGVIVGSPLVKNGIGFVVRDKDGLPAYFLSATPDFFGGVKDVTFTPIAGQAVGPITVPGNAVGFAVSPDGTLAYVVTDSTTAAEATVTVIDLDQGQIVATSSTVPGHAGPAITPPSSFDGSGGLVFGADGKGYLTTWIRNPDGSYTTQVSGLPGLAPGPGLTSLNFALPDDGAGMTSAMPSMVATGGAGEFDLNSTNPTALLSV